MGWVFMLRVDPEEGLHELEDWIDRWGERGSKIISEYGTQIQVHQMLDIITDRENASEQWSENLMARNNAILGPRGLYRGANNDIPVDDATYDLVSGEFS